jgi:hypothetical protein
VFANLASRCGCVAFADVGDAKQHSHAAERPDSQRPAIWTVRPTSDCHRCRMDKSALTPSLWSATWHAYCPGFAVPKTPKSILVGAARGAICGVAAYAIIGGVGIAAAGGAIGLGLGRFVLIGATLGAARYRNTKRGASPDHVATS